MAPLIAKLVLAPVIQQFQEAFPRATVDVWVDDISVDFVGNDAHVLCREALNGYEKLKDGLEGVGLQLSRQDWLSDRPSVSFVVRNSLKPTTS